MKTKNKIAIAACAGMATLAPFAAQAHHHHHGGAGLVGGLVGGIIGGAIANAANNSRTVYVQQPTTTFVEAPTVRVETVPTVTQTIIEEPVFTETIVEEPVFTQTIVTRPATTITFVPTTTVIYDAWGRQLPPPAVLPLGRPIHDWGRRGWDHAPAHFHRMEPRGGFRGGHPARSGCRGR